MDIERKIEGIKQVIRRQLIKADAYSTELSYQIELAASDILLYRKLRSMALDEDTKVTVVEYSRENQPREHINPVFDAMKKQADVVRKDLRSLYMNRELRRKESTKEPNEEPDPLDEMMRRLNAIDDE